ncbi:MAG: hypothetical protein V3V46_06080, partial [Anaerolineales bacterium]
ATRILNLSGNPGESQRLIALAVGVRLIDWKGVGGTTVSDASPVVEGNVPKGAGPSPTWHALINNTPRRVKLASAIKRR